MITGHNGFIRQYMQSIKSIPILIKVTLLNLFNLEKQVYYGFNIIEQK